MYHTLYLGVTEDMLQKFNNLRERQFFDSRCNTLQGTCNGAEPMGSFPTFSFFVISNAILQPLLLMLQLIQLRFVAVIFLLEQVTLHVFLIHFNFSFSCLLFGIAIGVPTKPVLWGKEEQGSERSFHH